jgi:uncharacterized repeat protein (TIGR03847 family)
MANIEKELNPVDFITIGTVGPKGQRVFHLQAGKTGEIISLTIEKEQAFALGEAIRELLEGLNKRFPHLAGRTTVDLSQMDMDLREPIEPMFRVAQMGLGYDEDRDLVILVAQELLTISDDEDPADAKPSIVRLWCSREQMAALSAQALQTVQAGRPDPKLNGRIVYYWT